MTDVRWLTTMHVGETTVIAAAEWYENLDGEPAQGTIRITRTG